MNAVSWLEGLSSPDRRREALLARAPQIATWVLAIAVAVRAALLVTNLAGANRVPDPQPAAPLAAAGTPVQRSVDIAAITNAHLFGAAEVQAPAELDAANAPRTSMPLVLSGIIAADDPLQGMALIGENASATRVYVVGDNLPGGARLHSVHGDRVLLDRGGRLEALTLPREVLAGAAPPPPPLPSAEPVADSSAVERMRQLISEEPGLVADIMRPQPVFAQGKQRGYRLYPGRNRQAFMRLGLRPGDLVVAINGTPLDDPARGAEIFRTIGSSSQAQVTVMRNGRQQDLTLDMAQIAAQAEELMSAETTEPAEAATAPPEAPIEPVDEAGMSTE